MRRAVLTNGSLKTALASKTASRLARWGASSLAREIRIEFSNRLTASLGLSYPERGLIRLSASLLDDEAPSSMPLTVTSSHTSLYTGAMASPYAHTALSGRR